MSHRFLFLSLLLLSIHSFNSSAEEGTATFYNQPYVPSACYGNQNEGVMIAGASDTIWNNRRACGRMYRVQCTGATNALPHPCKQGATVTVKIVDYCPPPNCNGTINLSRDAFAQIANLDAGKIRVSFNLVQ